MNNYCCLRLSQEISQLKRNRKLSTVSRLQTVLVRIHNIQYISLNNVILTKIHQELLYASKGKDTVMQDWSRQNAICQF